MTKRVARIGDKLRIGTRAGANVRLFGNLSISGRRKTFVDATNPNIELIVNSGTCIKITSDFVRVSGHVSSSGEEGHAVEVQIRTAYVHYSHMFVAGKCVLRPCLKWNREVFAGKVRRRPMCLLLDQLSGIEATIVG